MSKVISHLGETMTTKHYMELSDDKYNELKYQYYNKPNIEDVELELKKVYDENRVMIPNITNYYFKDLMAKTKMHHSKWSIEEMWQSKELVGSIFARTRHNKKVYPDKHTDIQKFETALRLGGKGLTAKPSNFPLKTARQVIEKYNINDNYYDMSCGWGVRLLASLSLDVNYYGTDPNYQLVDRLNELTNDFKRVNKVDTHVEIKSHGSEVLVYDWVNTMGLCFTSPPYFNLEDYRVGDQSYSEGMKYQDWLDSFLEPTIKNCYLYLIDEGHLAVNINNFKSYNLVQDTINIAENNRFKHIDTLELKNINRPKSSGGVNDNNEGILIFKKI